MAFNEHGQEIRTGAAAASVTLTFTGSPTEDNIVTLVSTDGTSITYTAKDSPTTANNEFGGNSGVNTATSFKAALEHANGHVGQGKMTVSQPHAVQLLITQAVAGLAGNFAVVENENRITVNPTSGFSGGHDGDPFQIREDQEKTGAPHDDRTGDFTLNHYKNITSTYKHKSIPQVPFSRTMVPIRDPRVVAAPLTSTDDVV